MTRIGSRAFQQVCATKLQRIARGYIVRKGLKVQFKKFYKEGKGNSAKRKEFFESEFKDVAGKMAINLDEHTERVDTMLRY